MYGNANPACAWLTQQDPLRAPLGGMILQYSGAFKKWERGVVEREREGERTREREREREEWGTGLELMSQSFR